MDKMTFLPEKYTLTVTHYDRDLCFVVKIRDSGTVPNKRTCITEVYYLYESSDIISLAELAKQLLYSSTYEISSDDSEIANEVRKCLDDIADKVQFKYEYVFANSLHTIAIKTFAEQIEIHILAEKAL